MPNYSGVPRVSLLEKSLFACDELAGFLTACSYVKPGKSIFEVDLASAKKKLKDKAFARAVNREDIINGAKELGVDLDQHVAFCIEAMKGRAADLGSRARRRRLPELSRVQSESHEVPLRRVSARRDPGFAGRCGPERF